jgi:predicted ATPase/transcriptional regulator with XRE-family HTH domain
VTKAGGEGLAAWLRQWRHTNRWTQERLAEALGYEVSYIAKIERGRRRPTEQFVTRLADVAAIPRQELLQLCRRPTARLRLPVPPGAIVGRAREVAEVSELLRHHRSVTLVGAPGIGKTSVALEVGWRVGEEYRHGACFVPLAEVSESQSVTAAVVQRLGLAEQAGRRGLDDLVIQALRNQAMLLVLDNFEHVLDAAPFVERLLLKAPCVRVLATSREALGLAEEEEYALRPLAFPDPFGEPDDAASYPAVELFVMRSRLVRPDFALDAGNVRPVVDICSRLDGLPLAISLAAAASKLLSPLDIVRSLGRRLELPVDMLTGPHVDRRLTAALDWSWDLLQPSQQALFARLGVFAAGYSLAAVENVCAERADGEDLLPDLAALESKSLIEAVPSSIGISRFSSLETVRRYAEHRLRESGRLDELRQRHCAYYVEVADAVEPHLAGGRDQARSLSLLDEEYANLATAFEWSLRRQPADALHLAASLRRFFSMRRISEGAVWLKAALDAAPEATPVYVKALNGYAALALAQGDLDVAVTTLGEARVLALELGATSELAVAILNQGNAAERRGPYDVAIRCYEEAIALYRQIGEERGVGHGLNGLGVIALHQNDHQAASELFLEALNRFRALNDRSSVALTATNLGWIAEMENELDEARDWYEESRRIREGIGDAYARARSTADLGRIARRQREPKLAAQLLEQALEVFHQTGDRRLAAAYLVELAAVAVQRKRHDMAARLLGAAEGVRHSLGAEAWPDEMALHDEVLASLVSAAEEGAVRRAVRTGRALSLEDAVEFVQGGTWPPTYRRWRTPPPLGDPASVVASSF